MNEIIKSASKIVLLLIVLTLCFSIIFGVVTRQVDYKDLIMLFSSLTMAVAGFYFANKGDNTKPYAGK